MDSKISLLGGGRGGILRGWCDEDAEDADRKLELRLIDRMVLEGGRNPLGGEVEEDVWVWVSALFCAERDSAKAILASSSSSCCLSRKREAVVGLL